MKTPPQNPWKQAAQEQPFIQRSKIYDFLPQTPGWFCNIGHIAGKHRFMRKLKTQYRLDELAECPMCAGDDLRLMATQERHGLPTSVMFCQSCGFMFTSPRLSQESLKDHYRRDYRDIERGIVPNLHALMFDLQYEKGELVWTRLRATPGFVETPSLTVAEIGCGEGGLLDWIRAHTAVQKVRGFELNIGAAQYGREKGLDISAEDFALDRDKFDIVIIEQVLEHLHHPVEFMESVAASQSEGALLFVGVPGILASAAHYGDNFISYLEYGHLNHYTLHTLERLVVPHGYELVSGDEVVRAVFRKVSAIANPVYCTKTTPPAHILDYIEEQEARFQERGGHLWRSLLAYTRYLILAAWGQVLAWRKHPLFRDKGV